MSSDWYYVVRTRWGWLLWEECDLLVSDVGRRAGERLGRIVGAVLPQQSPI